MLSKGRYEKAWEVIRKLHSNPDDPHDSFARKELYQMTQQFALDKQKQETLGITRWWHFFKHPSYRRRVLIGCGATLSSACSGNLVVNSKLLISPPSYGR